MLKKLGKLPLLYGQYGLSLGRGDVPLCNVTLTKRVGLLNGIFDLRNFHISTPLCELVKRGRKSIQTREREDESKFADFSHGSKRNIFPDANLPDTLFNGTLFKDLPIVNVKVSRNNTIMNLTDSKGVTKLIRSCGVEGFRNAKKGTNLSAQATALTFSRRAVDMGYKTVRVRIQGLGPGRVSSVRGMVIGGLDIVSITDNSHVADIYPRPKKQRRI